MSFAPVSTLADLDSLNEADILEGYLSTQRGDPEPGENRGRAFWHGWRNRMMDMGELRPDSASCNLAHEYLEAGRLRALSSPPSKKEGKG
jgi:hypothetical protein